jgi:prepilin-type N-terminal cleavage/methylation domain-containing protein
MKSKLLQRIFRKKPRKNKRFMGFTLIELLVAMLIATIIISTLLYFVVGVLETNKREEAKAASQDEIQSALNYIVNDLREAVYIYDADGLATLTASPSQLPSANSGTTTGTPILVFWKRRFYDTEDTVTLFNGSTRKVRCLPYAVGTETAPVETPIDDPGCRGGSQYVYSLVVYYLVMDSTIPNPAKINRWELRAGIPGGNFGNAGAAPANCAESIAANCPAGAQRADVTVAVDPTSYYVLPSVGYSPFSLSGGGNLTTRMNAWRKAVGSTYLALTPSNFPTLVDFIDGNPSNNANIPVSITAGNAPADPNGSLATAQSCANPDLGVGTGGAQRIPATFPVTTGNDVEKLSSFYVCVSSSQTTARIYLRGSALARLYKLPDQLTAGSINTTFLPSANVRVFGRGFLNVN